MRVFEVKSSKKTRKQVKALNKKLKLLLLDLFLKLKSDPVPVDEFNVAKVSGSKNSYRIRIQRIRVLYDVYWKKKRIEVLKVEKKKDRTYKKL